MKLMILTAWSLGGLNFSELSDLVQSQLCDVSHAADDRTRDACRMKGVSLQFIIVHEHGLSHSNISLTPKRKNSLTSKKPKMSSKLVK